MQQPLNENKELILIPKESLITGALCLHIALERLAYYWGISGEECYYRLEAEALYQAQKLSVKEESEIIEAWTKTIQERKRDLN